MTDSLGASVVREVQGFLRRATAGGPRATFEDLNGIAAIRGLMRAAADPRAAIAARVLPARSRTNGSARNLVKPAAVLATVGGLAAVAGEAALRSVPPSVRPFSGPVHARVEIEAPIEEVWAVIADIPAQVRWMPEMKRVRMLTPEPVAEGSVGEATVRIFGISVTDRVTITTFQPPTAFGIEHEGLFGGGGRLDLRPGLDGTTTIVDWEEHLVPPLLPAFGWFLGRPVLAWLYQRDLFLLRDIVEDDPRLSAAAG